MAVSNRKETISRDIKTVWEMVTNLKKYEWRSDLSEIEILAGGREFIEYTKDGYMTKFTVTLIEPYSRYEFDMENENMKGHWTGIFTDNGGSTTLDFTEDVAVKKALMKPFAKMYLKHQQKQYMEDLRRELEAG